MNLPTFEELGLQLQTLRALRNEGIETPSPLQSALLTALLNGQSLFLPPTPSQGLHTALAIAALELAQQEIPQPQTLILSPNPNSSAKLALRILQLSPSSTPPPLAQLHPNQTLPPSPCPPILLINDSSVHNYPLPLSEPLRLLILLDPIPTAIHSLPPSQQALVLARDISAIESLAPHLPKLQPLSAPQPQLPPPPPFPFVETAWESLPPAKNQTLLWLLTSSPHPQALIFFLNRTSALASAHFLSAHNLPCFLITANTSAEEITAAARSFEQGSLRYLLLTDCSLPTLPPIKSNLIVHFEPPFDPISYLLRLQPLHPTENFPPASALLTSPNELPRLHCLESLLHRKFTWRTPPPLPANALPSLLPPLEKALAQLRSSNPHPLLPAILSLTANGFTPSQLAAAFLALLAENPPPPPQTVPSQPQTEPKSDSQLHKPETQNRKSWRQRIVEKKFSRSSRRTQLTPPSNPFEQTPEPQTEPTSLSHTEPEPQPIPPANPDAAEPLEVEPPTTTTETLPPSPETPPQPEDDFVEIPSEEQRVAEILGEEDLPPPKSLSRSKSPAAIDDARWLRVSVGSNHGVREHDLQALVEVVCNLPHSAIGEIRIENSFSLVEIRPAFAATLPPSPLQITTDAGPIHFRITSPPSPKKTSSRCTSSRRRSSTSH